MIDYNGRKFYTLKEVHEILHICMRTLYSWIKEGKLQAVMVAKKWYVPEEEVEKFLKVEV